MRRSHLATALVVLATGLTVSRTLRRLAGGRRAETVPAAATATAGDTGTKGELAPVPDRNAVVLPFARRIPAAPAVERPVAAPARCGDSGGRTKAGAPCGARAASGGRCHHHRVAA